MEDIKQFDDLPANAKKYIIGNPKKEKPIILRLLDKKLHYKLLFYPIYILEKLMQTEQSKLKMVL